jgi:hypothetical protein
MKTKGFIEVCGKDVKVEGGLIRIGYLDGDKYTFPDDPEAMLGELRECGTRVDLFTFLQKLPETSPKYSYPMEWDNLAVLSVTSFDHWWAHQIRSVARNRARQAGKRGVVFREVPFGDELVQGICGIYNECPIRLGKRFPHYGMTLERGRAYAGTFLDRSVYIGAFLGNSMIGFIKLVADESRRQACLIHILSMVRHKDKAVTNALIAEAVRYCADHGISYLVYERFSYGKKQMDSLSHFKEVNGFQRVDMPRYFVPLTALGQIAFRLGLHRRLADHVPESVASKFRNLRKAWYERKVQTVTEA